MKGSGQLQLMASVAGNRITLNPRELPARWYNLAADLPFAIPPMMTPSGYRVTRGELKDLFPDPVIEQELNGDQRTFNIPRPVRDAYAHWRPTPMFRARALEEELGTPAKLFYKFEGGSPSGSYESITSLAQAYYVKDGGFDQIVTGGVGGVWISAIGHAAALFGLKSRVYSVRRPGTDRPWGEAAAMVWDVDVVASPSDQTRAGRHRLESHGPDSGSVAVALSEAYEEAMVRPEVKFAMPTLLNHTAVHNSIIGLEAQRQLAAVEEAPDCVVGSIGAGVHFAGLIAPFVPARIGGSNVRFIAVEDAAIPSLTRGVYAAESADSEGLMPSVQMYTLGRDYAPPGVLAGAMRYHGVSPLVSALFREKIVEAVAHRQVESYSAGLMFTRAEGIVLSPSSMYTVKEVIDRALAAKESGSGDTVLFSVTADVQTESSPYDSLLAGRLEDQEPQENLLRRSLSRIMGRG